MVHDPEGDWLRNKTNKKKLDEKKKGEITSTSRGS